MRRIAAVFLGAAALLGSLATPAGAESRVGAVVGAASVPAANLVSGALHAGQGALNVATGAL